MNIETINDYLTGFREQVVESGFLRDVNDFSTSGPNNQNNIVGLREIARNVFLHLERIHESDLPEALTRLFPTQVPVPFTAKGYFEKLKDLLDDKAVQQNAFFGSLQSILSSLQVDLTSNNEEVERIKKFIKPYTLDQQRTLSTEEKAIVSIIFKDQKTTGALNEFAHTLSAWNRILPLYHQLVTNTSPHEERALILRRELSLPDSGGLTARCARVKSRHAPSFSTPRLDTFSFSRGQRAGRFAARATETHTRRRPPATGHRGQRGRVPPGLFPRRGEGGKHFLCAPVAGRERLLQTHARQLAVGQRNRRGDDSRRAPGRRAQWAHPRRVEREPAQRDRRARGKIRGAAQSFPSARSRRHTAARFGIQRNVSAR